jgi:hypothetical protein
LGKATNGTGYSCCPSRLRRALLRFELL